MANTCTTVLVLCLLYESPPGLLTGMVKQFCMIKIQDRECNGRICLCSI